MSEVEKLARWVRILVVTFVIVGSVSFIDKAFGPFDWLQSVDSTDGDSRSGLRLSTDAETGCQYLGQGGALIPRVDAGGNHMCGQ